ncbi:DUF305 domain-containing protein [Rubrivirga sp. IMCC43871]|uniref:DUF305 domain-containing protein n=1 Tax=Rubrivirga sp. IMCC43871 TaxID=3391575 RepID=UPI00398FD872
MRVLPVLAVAAVLAVSGCAPSAALDTSSPSVSSPDASDSGPSVAELEALYRARQQADLQRYSDDDAEFMAGMIHHHAQALVMAEMARRNGAGPAVARLAARIDNAQHDEIATMQRWLVDRGLPAPAVAEDGTTSMSMDHAGMDHGGMDHAGMDHGDSADGGMAPMPGMLTAAQLAELDAARGADFDRLFLTFMIQHHAGAVSMVEHLFAQDGAAQNGNTFKLASDIQVDQRTEIARMQLMLDGMADD